MHVPSLVRTRWAAVGAAIAIALGAGGLGIANATIGSGERTVFVPIEPCRLFDTRPDFQVGPRSAPLGPNDTYTVIGTGTVGDCALPADAVGLALNVTALRATRPTFITVWEAGADRPNASHLNPAPGQAPAPNAVTTNLGADDRFNIYNRFGTVHVLADAVGYYADHHHDDRYYTKNQTYTRAEADAAFQPAGDYVETSDLAAPVTMSVSPFGLTAMGDGSFGTLNNCRSRLEAGSTTSHLPIDLPVGSELQRVDVVAGVVGSWELAVELRTADPVGNASATDIATATGGPSADSEHALVVDPPVTIGAHDSVQLRVEQDTSFGVRVCAATATHLPPQP